MPSNIRYQNGQYKQKREYLNPKDYEELMRWRLIVALIFVYATFLLSGVVGYGITRDIHYLLFITPTILLPFIRLLVPMDRRKYELELAKIQASNDLASMEGEFRKAQSRIRYLEAKLRKQQIRS